MRRNHLLPLMVMITATLLLSATGCGKKGDPVPPQARIPAPITDLKVDSIQGGVALVWSIQDSRGDIGSFKILRSVTLDGSLACPGCPQDYRPFAILKPTDDGLRREGEKGFRYHDSDVRDGGYYSYRIAVCNRTGQCSVASNEAGTIRKDR